MKPISSVISGLVKQAETALSSTGPQHGETGVAIDEAAARARLVGQTPAETDRKLGAWLESSLGIVAKPAGRMMFPLGGGYYLKIEGFDFRGLTDENRSAARNAVQAAMTRPTLDQCEVWIASLHAATARRADDEAGQELTMTLYASRLSQYPADIAKQVCMDFALRRAKPNWFPTLSELDEACEKAANKRAQLFSALAG